MGVQATLGQVIGRNALRFPRQPAIVSPAFAPLAYQDLQLQLDGIRGQLRHAGFDCRARIAVLMPNGPEAILAIVGVACCCTAVPIDPRLSPVEMDQRFDMLRPDALLVMRGAFPEARRIAERRRLTLVEAVPIAPGRLGLSMAVQGTADPVLDEEPDPSSPAFILQTSGTIAEPKLIPFSHANMLAAAERLKTWFLLTPQDRCLSVSPPYYSHGLKVTIFTPLLTGGSIAIPSNAAAVDLTEWFDALRPTWYSAGPTLHNAVLDKARALADVQAMHTLRMVVSGGAPLPGAVRDELQRTLSVPVLEHYGSSEAAQMASNRPPPGPSRPGSCGQPWPGTLMIAGEDGRPLPAGDQGEIWVRGPTVMAGYLDAPDLNRSAFADGWLRTGDLGSLDEDGYLFLHGRLNELINRGGEKIAPAEIDAALLRHPAVAEAAAFAVPHPRLDEDVAAAVVLHPGAEALPADLRQFLQSELASFKIPRRIHILDQLPKGSTGKVQRRRLKDMLDAPHEPAERLSVTTEGPRDLRAELLLMWRRLLKSEALSDHDDFFESGGDSLLAMEMLLEVERLIGHPVPETVMIGAETIHQLVPRIVEQVALPTTPVHQFHTEGDRPPLYFFHGELSGGTGMRRMVQLLGPDQPITAVDPHGMNGEPIPATIEAMAADRLPLLLEKQTSGSYFLGGYCNGALTAFETARLLVAAGRKVEMVAMIDPPTISARPTTRAMLKLLKPILSGYRLAQIYDQLARLERILRMSPGEVFAKTYERIGPDKRSQSVSRWHPYTIAMARYRPAPFDVPVVFFSAGHNGHAWRGLCPKLEVIEMPGGHNNCLTAGAEILVKHLRQRIDLIGRGMVPQK
ncbi:AMP-binding protein [Microvirga lotononidis]|uniref:AMP-binding protein n=1 Tax=Microvirga lotononidis TaxID=864069 RepID=UPI00030990EB|nr:AMP-binding protein [Microvirga lotononidis]WQO26499.1 AMP-binding protein [Microvirga lotononidis]